MANIRKESRKLFKGIVVSTKMNKTVVVEVESKFSHPRFGKLVIQHAKYHAHDEKEECKVGDTVEIVETRPISKTKFYRINAIVSKAK
jgi:small subunit ribosomal protein S17